MSTINIVDSGVPEPLESLLSSAPEPLQQINQLQEKTVLLWCPICLLIHKAVWHSITTEQQNLNGRLGLDSSSSEFKDG